jgi:hypothetical protein
MWSSGGRVCRSLRTALLNASAYAMSTALALAQVLVMAAAKVGTAATVLKARRTGRVAVWRCPDMLTQEAGELKRRRGGSVFDLQPDAVFVCLRQ